jgi:hypothetical protein
MSNSSTSATHLKIETKTFTLKTMQNEWKITTDNGNRSDHVFQVVFYSFSSSLMYETTILCVTDATVVNGDVLDFCDRESLTISFVETYYRKLGECTS